MNAQSQRITDSTHRSSFIGGSDARIIVGDDEAALLRLWREKRGEVEPEDLSGNLIVRLGSATEELNRRWCEANSRQAITDIQQQVRQPTVRYPLSRVLATEAKVSVGNVKRSRRHCRRFSLSADQRAIQPGNSVGPLLDASGHLVGIVTRDSTRYACRSWWGIFRRTYCTQAEVARTFLDSKRIGYQTARSDQQLSSADIGDIARPFTVHIECEQASRRRLAFSLGNFLSCW